MTTDGIVLYHAEFKLCTIVWDNEPLKSAQLAELAASQLGWKKTTTYTVLKKLIDRGILMNDKTIVTSIIKREQAQRSEGVALLNRVFDGKLPQLFASFLNDRSITEEEAAELHDIIDRMKKEK